MVRFADEIPELIAAARRRGRPRPCMFVGRHPEAQPVMSAWRACRSAWSAESADAPHFLVAAAICADGLPEYVRTMEGLCWAAETTLEWAYMAAVELTYKGLLEMEVAATRRGQPWASDPIGDRMQALVNGGIDAAAREAVLRGLEPAYSDAVVYARQVGNL